MSNLTNTIEAILFASGEAVPTKYIVEKLNVTLKEVNAVITELKQKYDNDSGILLLTFNGKIQFASNPKYKKEISDVLTPIKEKELSKTILECAALIAYKQPVTKGEIEEIRQVSCDYAIHALLEMDMIYACGRKDAIGKPILYATTDNFLKRFKLNSIDDLPDYEELMAQIAQLNSEILGESGDAYLYQKEEYTDDQEHVDVEKETKPEEDEGADDELPEFLVGEEDVIKID